MKLKKLVLGVVAAGTLMAATSAMAGLELINHSSTPSVDIWVKCSPGTTGLPGVFSKNVDWGVVESLYLGGNASGTCTFYKLAGGSVVGTGTITISGSGSTATGAISNITHGSDFTVTPSGTPSNLVITLAN